MGFTPNLVSLLSLLTSVAGLWLVATSPRWSWVVGGAALVHFGLLLDHADGQVARRTGKGSTWGMYLDFVIDRVVEIGLVAALVLAGPVRGAPSWMPADAVALGPDGLLLVGALTAGAMMSWRVLTLYNDVLYLRSHLLETQRLPGMSLAPSKLTRRPGIPFVFNRDWLLLIGVVGIVVAQFHATLVLFLVMHLVLNLEKVIVFRVRHQEPEGDAARILQRDYH